ncbi:MAG: glycerol-3-phosphate acyltransferase [Lachnospiraceae bacterium]|nr:glycerol-3-phosphate acyltransferase [Lachnospiraceae bacterium]
MRKEETIMGHQIIMVIVGVLCGSVLFSRYLPKWIKKVDVVALSDDHNPGTANAMQHAGIPVGILCLLGDILKGVLPMHLALRLGLESGCLFPLIMTGPVLGHAYSLFHRGRGGKAIAVSFGVLIGLMPIHTEPIFALCSIYLFFSLVVRIRPHTRRTRVTYSLLALSSLYMLYARWIPWQICGGILMLSCVVVHKNSLRQQVLEQQAAQGTEKTTTVSA